MLVDGVRYIIHVIFTLSTLSDGCPGLAAGRPYNLMTDSDYDGWCYFTVLWFMYAELKRMRFDNYKSDLTNGVPLFILPILVGNRTCIYHRDLLALTRALSFSFSLTPSQGLSEQLRLGPGPGP